MEKMTYVAALNYAIENLDNAEVTEKLTTLRNSIIKRNTKSDKLILKDRAKQDAVREVLRSATAPMTVTEIKYAHEIFAEMNIQKLSAIVRKMMLNGEVVRTEAKHKAVFALA